MIWSLPWEIVGRVIVAAVLGAVIGFEREADDHPAGVRTFMAVALGSGLFGVISTVGFDAYLTGADGLNHGGDVTRVASQVVVGIGFLGAGLIFRRGEAIVNLTTAASLWATAAVGLAAGIGEAGLAVASTVVLTVVLVAIPTPTRWLVARFGRVRRTLHLVPGPGVTLERLRDGVEHVPELTVVSWQIEKLDERLVVQCHITARTATALEARLADLATTDLVSSLRFI